MNGILRGAILALALAGAIPGSALAHPVNDLSAARASRAPAAHRIGTLVHFTVVARNGGPDLADILYVNVPYTSTLFLEDEVCSTGVSADTPFCEWSAVPAGHKRYARVTLRVIGSVNGHASTTACVIGGDGDDPNPANDCVRLSVVVPGS